MMRKIHDELIIYNNIDFLLCCNNLLFPIEEDADLGDVEIYKKYLDYLYEYAQENPSGVPYIEDSLQGIYQSL